jgi:hypothetical protein
MATGTQPNIAAEVVLNWADGDYLFALKLKQIEELQRLCRAGLGEIAQRLFSGRWYAADVVETIRLGLIGGGLPPARARELVETYVDGRPIADPRDANNALAVAQAVLGAAYFGVAEALGEDKAGDGEGGDQPGKEEAATEEESTSRPSTARDSPSASPPETSEG